MPSGRATSTIALVMSMSAREGVGSPEGWLCTTLLLFIIALKIKEFREVVELYGAGDWERFRVLPRDHHTSSPVSVLSRFDARHVTVFF